MWPDNRVLLDLNRRDVITFLNALTNFLILGGIGSGKSSGPFQYLLRAMARAGFGGLLLCVKQDAAETYGEWMLRDGRGGDVIEFGPGYPATFNFLDYIAQSSGGDTLLMVEEVVAVLVEVMVLLRRRDGRSYSEKEHGFFRDAADKLFRAAIVVLVTANGHLRINDLRDFLSSIPRNPDEPLSERLFAVRQIREARNRLRSEGREAEIQAAVRFLDHDFVGYPIETREGVRATAQVTVDPLVYEPLASLFGKSTSVTPDDILKGKLLLLHPSIHERPALGQITAGIWKVMLQRAILARKIEAERESVCPVFIAADEAHELAGPTDVKFVSSSRSQRAVTLYCTQTITSLREALGPSAMSTLLAGLKVRFICRTDDPETAKWVRETTNQAINDMSPRSPDAQRLVDFATDGFRELREGGPDVLVEAIAVRGNQPFRINGRRWCRVKFRQTPASGVAWRWQRWTTNQAQIVLGPRNSPRK